jgi:hypothetical protein
VLLYQYDQKIREVKQTISEKIQPVINELKRLSADLRRHTLKHKNAMAKKYKALKLPDGTSSNDATGVRKDVGTDVARNLRDVLTRDQRIMQYVLTDSSSSGTTSDGLATNFPSSHIQVEVSDLFRRKRELGTQIRELESALSGSTMGLGSNGGNLSSDLVRIIEEQFRMYESIAAKIAVIHRRVEEEKTAIRAELRANPEGKVDPWLEVKADPLEKKYRDYRNQKEKAQRDHKAAKKKAEEKERSKKPTTKKISNDPFSGNTLFGLDNMTQPTNTKSNQSQNKAKETKKNDFPFFNF